MKLTFGLALDGFRPAPGTVAIGELTCGPVGMLDWLENRLGLRRPAVTEAQRAERRLDGVVKVLQGTNQTAGPVAAELKGFEAGVMKWRELVATRKAFVLGTVKSP